LKTLFILTALLVLMVGHSVADDPQDKTASHRNQTGTAADVRMKDDLHHAAVAIEFFYGTHGNSYRGATLADLIALGFRPSDGVTLTILDASDKHYKLEATASGGSAKSWIFDSDIFPELIAVH